MPAKSALSRSHDMIFSARLPVYSRSLFCSSGPVSSIAGNGGRFDVDRASALGETAMLGAVGEVGDANDTLRPFRAGALVSIGLRTGIPLGNGNSSSFGVVGVFTEPSTTTPGVGFFCSGAKKLSVSETSAAAIAGIAALTTHKKIIEFAHPIVFFVRE